jgi:hypothetical protein
MMTVLNLTAEWDWENADPEPESYGYVTLRVHGFEVARIPMTFWHQVRQDEPSHTEVEQAAGEWLTDRLAAGPVVRALAEEAKTQRAVAEGKHYAEDSSNEMHFLLAEVLDRIVKAADGRPGI